MRVKLLEPIEGFEDVAEWRVPEDGEVVYSSEYNTVTAGVNWIDEKLVLTPIKRWRPATIDDAVRVSKGAEIYARFCEKDRDDWMTECLLTGLLIRRDKRHVWYSQYRGFDICEVLDA